MILWCLIRKDELRVALGSQRQRDEERLQPKRRNKEEAGEIKKKELDMRARRLLKRTCG